MISVMVSMQRTSARLASAGVGASARAVPARAASAGARISAFLMGPPLLARRGQGACAQAPPGPTALFWRWRRGCGLRGGPGGGLGAAGVLQFDKPVAQLGGPRGELVAAARQFRLGLLRTGDRLGLADQQGADAG